MGRFGCVSVVVCIGSVCIIIAVLLILFIRFILLVLGVFFFHLLVEHLVDLLGHVKADAFSEMDHGTGVKGGIQSEFTVSQKILDIGVFLDDFNRFTVCQV